MFKLAESLFIEESIENSIPESVYIDIYNKVNECMKKVTSEKDCFVFVHDNTYFIELAHNRNFTESGPEGEFLTIISLASDKEKEIYSEEPVLIEIEIKE